MDRESLVYEARLAEQAERFEEMVEHMKAVIQSNGGSTELNPDERNLLSVAYKNVIGSRRRAWRVLLALESKHASIPDKKDLIATYKETIETELSTICADINTIIENVLIPGSTNDEAKVFYFKMAGDYYRYQAEYTMDTVREQNKADAEKAYADATKFALNLQATHPIRLGLALNFSVFYYEIKEESKAACDLANKAFEDAISELDSLNEESYKDSTLIMQLLRDNLTLWNADNSDKDGGDMEANAGAGTEDAPVGEDDILPVEDM